MRATLAVKIGSERLGRVLRLLEGASQPGQGLGLVGRRSPGDISLIGGVGGFLVVLLAQLGLGQGRPGLGRILARGNQIDRQYDINGNVGGPVVKGKGWFFFSYRLNNQYTFITGLDSLAQSKLSNYTIKGTYQLSRNNQLIGYWNKREKLQPLRDVSLVRPVSTAC